MPQPKDLDAYRIAVMAGDGIGPAAVDQAVRVLAAAAEGEPGLRLDFTWLPVGLDAHARHGSTLPTETIETLREHEAWMLGPLTTHVYAADDPTMVNASATLRKQFELYANVRPVRSFAGVPGTFPNVDLVVVRENTEGMYADRNVLDGNGELRPDADTVVSVRVVTRRASERVARVAFDLARSRDRRKTVTLVHKANVLRHGCGLFLDACHAVGREYPDIDVDDFHVDAMAMHLVMRPQEFDVIVTTNLFGDVLSDEAAGLVGGLGLAPGLNVGDNHAMAQATHGSAPELAEAQRANPIAEILSAGMLLEWLGTRHSDAAAINASRRVPDAVSTLLASSSGTPDVGGSAKTADVGDALLEILSNPTHMGDQLRKG